MITPPPWLSRLAVLVVLCAAPIFAIAQLAPPAPHDAGADSFAADRALGHVRQVARAPHPVGSAEHARVRDYIVGQLRALGVTPELQRASVADHETSAMLGMTDVENIVARLPGTGPDHATGAVLLVGHYDSVPTGPGASDDGHAVGVLLETLRALRAGPPLARDVILLFSDGEELGLLGARAFAASPQARGIALALNFEARGTGGPAFMFQTSGAGLVRALGDAAPWPMASSLLDEVYRRLPNDTDLSALMAAGLPGMNFAYFDHYAGYHSARDAVDALDPASLQQQGDNALALARRFAGGDLPVASGGDATWFHVTRGHLVWYPRIVDVLALLAVALGAIGLIVRGRLRLRGVAVGAVALAAALIGGTVIARAGWAQLGPRVMPANPTGGLVGGGWVVIAAVAAALAGVLVACRIALRWARVAELAVGALVTLVALGAGLVAVAPGGAYLVVWPAAGALLGGAALATAPANTALSGGRTALLALGAVIPLWLIAPWLRLSYALLGLAQPAVFVGLAVVMLGGALPAVLASCDGWRWRAPFAAGVIATFALCLGLRTTGATPAQPATDSVDYALDTDTGRAAWITDQRPVDGWASKLIGDAEHRTAHDGFFPFTDWTFYQAPAYAVALPAPSLTVVDDAVAGDVRHLRVHVRAGGPAEATLVYLQAGHVRGARVAGQRFDHPQVSDTARWAVRYTGAPADGFELDLDVDAGAPVALRVVDQYHGLGQVPAPARPAALAASPFGFGSVDQTYVGKTFRDLTQPLHPGTLTP